LLGPVFITVIDLKGPAAPMSAAGQAPAGAVEPAAPAPAIALAPAIAPAPAITLEPLAPAMLG
jgi:hypothetical protein